MSDVRDVRLKKIIEAIERYLLEHPAAADNEFGIAEWWLPEIAVTANSDEVSEALSILVAKGVVEKLAVSDNRYIWRAVRGKR
ncbi:MAG TPA: hypothetical protein VFW00_12445 [Rhodocyclaceae bacterium]|nr:hypothetical protein [Rhodocyclaceae bacterium]